MISPRYIEEVAATGERYTRMEPDLILYRETLIILIREHNELEARVERMEGRREPA